MNREPFDVTHSGESGTLPNPEAFVERWIDAFDRDPAASIHHHPELVLRRHEGEQGPPWIHARWDGERIESLAALVPKTLPLEPVPGLGTLMRLHGSRLVASRLLGVNDAAALDSFLDAVVDALADRRTDCVYLEDVEVGSTLWRGIERLRAEGRFLVFGPESPQQHWWIQFPAVRQDYWNGFSSKTRNTLRRKAKRFEHRVRRITDLRDIPTFVEQAHNISRESWQTRRVGLRVHDDEATRAFLQQLAGKGALRSYILEHGGVPVAFLIGSQWNGRFAYEEVAYRSEYASHSPGTVLLYEALQDLTGENCPDVLDFGTGDADYKRIFGNRETMSGPLMLVAPGWSRSLTIRLVRLRRELRGRGLRLLKGLGLHSTLRRWYRRGS